MSNPSGNVVPILLPQAGNSMEEGTIVKWMVKEGDRVKAGDILFELETDKATIEVEAETAGRLSKIVLPEGGTAPVKTPVAYFAENDADVAALLGSTPTVEKTEAPKAEATSAPMPSLIHSISTPSTRVKASPVARRVAADLGIDLATIGNGSGPDGRILLEDVQRQAKQAKPTPKATTASIPAAAGGTRKPMDKMRRAIARNLTTSKQTVPHWYATISVDAQPMLDYYKAEKQLYPCSLNDVIIQVCGRIVQEMPAFRSQADGDDIVQFETVNIGLAVALESGLVVPVVKNVDHLNLKGIATESRRVIEAAKTGKLEGVGEGMFTISNLGMFGVEEFAAIINPPESGILAVGGVREEAIVKDGALRIGKKMTVTLSADHRIIDGVTSAKFLSRFKELIENPSLL